MDTNETQSPDLTVKNVTIEFAKGCAEGAVIVTASVAASLAIIKVAHVINDRRNARLLKKSQTKSN